jgi:hypothetical protein
MTERQGIVPMTADEISRTRRTRVVAGLRTVLPAAIKALEDSIAFRQATADLPVIRLVHAKLTSRRRSNDHGVSPTAAPQPPPIILPPKEMIPYLSSQTEYSIKKATANIGYQPQFDLRTGMALTEEWARWARLV